MAYQPVGNESAALASERAAGSERLSQGVNHQDAQHVTAPNGREIAVPSLNHRAVGRPVDIQYDRQRASVLARIRAIGVVPGTVVSFLPIQLRTDSLLGPSRQAKIMPPKDGEDYSVFVFREVYIEPSRRGQDPQILPNEWHPIQMATEFAKLYPAGVFTFSGDPSLLQDEIWLKTVSREELHGNRTYGESLESARRAGVRWMQEQLSRGQESTRQNRPWTDPQKLSARRLFHLGFIKEMPKEVERQRDLALKIPQCPKCQRPSEPNAAQCTNAGCGYIIDPRRAYEISAIPESDPSLERLLRSEVTEMGISDYVAETADEKTLRLASGVPKPLSIAAARLQAAQDKYDADQRKAAAAHTAEMLGETVAKATRSRREQ